MPEGPELHLNSRFVNHICKSREFRGKVIKSDVSKSCDVPFTSCRYIITSQARGKEMALTLQCLVDPQNAMRILFRFGMSGKFQFGPQTEIPKHSHLRFYTNEQPENVLSFVDVRRFGSWQILTEGWGKDRGPDPMFEHEAFRQNVLENLEDPVFKRSICEVLLNQKYFNGIGNYLRAEILFRAGVPPFVSAKKALEPLKEQDREPTDLLQLCHDVPLEVIDMKMGFGIMTGKALDEEDYRQFMGWLRCYEHPDMRNLKDHNNRTIWFKGEAGPMAPTAQKSRTARRRKPASTTAVTVKKEEVERQENETDVPQDGPETCSEKHLDLAISSSGPESESNSFEMKESLKQKKMKRERDNSMVKAKETS